MKGELKDMFWKETGKSTETYLHFLLWTSSNPKGNFTDIIYVLLQECYNCCIIKYFCTEEASEEK